MRGRDGEKKGGEVGKRMLIITPFLLTSNFFLSRVLG